MQFAIPLFSIKSIKPMSECIHLILNPEALVVESLGDLIRMDFFYPLNRYRNAPSPFGKPLEEEKGEVA